MGRLHMRELLVPVPLWNVVDLNGFPMGGAQSSQWQNVRGQRSIYGSLSLQFAAQGPTPGDPGYPRLEFANNGFTVVDTIVIPQDPSPDVANQLGPFVYKFNVQNVHRAVRLLVLVPGIGTCLAFIELYAGPDPGGQP